MNHSKSTLTTASRMVPPDVLLKFGYTPNGAIEYDSVASLLSFSYGGSVKVDIGAQGLNVRDGNGLVVGHTAKLLSVFGVTPELQVHGLGFSDPIIGIGQWEANTSGGGVYITKARGGAIGTFRGGSGCLHSVPVFISGIVPLFVRPPRVSAVLWCRTGSGSFYRGLNGVFLHCRTRSTFRSQLWLPKPIRRPLDTPPRI